MISIRPEVIEVAVEAARAVKGNKRAGVIAAIAVFCEAEGLTVEKRPLHDEMGHPLHETRQQRFVGPWHDVEVES